MAKDSEARNITPNDKIQKEFEQFHQDNPEVYTKLVVLSRVAKAHGCKRYGIQSLFELIRWHHDIEVKSHDPFKLNNAYSSRYARLIMEQEADLKDFFYIRRLNSQKQIIKLRTRVSKKQEEIKKIQERLAVLSGDKFNG